MADDVNEGTPERPPTTYEQIVEAIADLLQSGSDWLRQEAEATVREKVVLPIQRVGLTLAGLYVATTMLMIGMVAIAIGILIYAGAMLGYHVVLWIIGGVLVIASAVFLLVVKGRMQK